MSQCECRVEMRFNEGWTDWDLDRYVSELIKCPHCRAKDALLEQVPTLFARFEKKALGAWKGDGRPCFCAVIKLDHKGVRSHDERCQPVRDWLTRAAELGVKGEGEHGKA